MHIVGYGGKPGEQRITIQCSTDEEHSNILKALQVGAAAITVKDGQLVVYEKFQDVCHRVPDPTLADHWFDEPVLLKQIGQPPKHEKYDPPIYVHHIKGYHGKYEDSQKFLEEAGFECLRSRRGDRGMIWEIWYLPGVSWFNFEKFHPTVKIGDYMWHEVDEANGKLIKELMKSDVKKKDWIIKWLYQTVRPGRVDVQGESWCLTVDPDY